MTFNDLNKEYDKLQLVYGDENLDAIYYGGCKNNPKLCFVFMNPTGRNIATSKSWYGLKAPWLGTKNIWGLFYELNLLNKNLYESIKNKKSTEWTEEFAEEVYQNISDNKIFITNLAKCSHLAIMLIFT